jgi:prepilin-type N-terminal cleavage/methylation domain-containing protein
MRTNMEMPISLRGRKGVTLIELLVVLVISAILVAALYRTFIGQQKTYTVQEQVIDTQQNARVAMNKMIREIRQVGFGRVATVTTALNPNSPGPGALTIAMASGSTTLIEVLASNQIKVTNGTIFSSGLLSIDGVESHALDVAHPPVKGGDNNYTVTLNPGETILNSYSPNTPVYGIGTVSYQYDPLTLTITRDDGSGPQVLADNIESLQFTYYTSSTDEVGTGSPSDWRSIQRIRVTVTARTSMSDPDYKGGDGFRRRQITSYIKIRNPLSP